MCDLIVGRIPGVVEQMTNEDSGEGEKVGNPETEAVGQAVVTRGQRANAQKPYSELKVPDVTGLNKSPEEIKEVRR